MSKKSERDKKGRYAKGHKGGPGRPKGEPKDIVCKDGKKRSLTALLNDLLNTYEELGSDKFLISWAKHSHRNLNEFMKLLFRFVPEPKSIDPLSSASYEISEKYMPKIKIERVITDIRPDEHGDAIMKMPRSGDARNKRIMELQDKLKRKDGELRHLKALINTQGIKEIEHEPIRPVELPEHNRAEKQSKDS